MKNRLLIGQRRTQRRFSTPTQNKFPIRQLAYISIRFQAMNQSESFNQLTLPTLEYENKKMSLFGDVCETQFHYADFTEIGNYRTENTLNGEIEIYLDVQPLFDPNYNPLYVSN